MDNWLRPYRKGDENTLFETMRAEDRAECEAVSPGAVLPTLKLILGSSPKVAMWDSGAGLVMAFGCTPAADPLIGYPWVLATDNLRGREKVLMQYAPGVIDWFHESHPLLVNAKDASAKRHIRWLRRLGFTFFNTTENYGGSGRPFHLFARIST